MKANNFIEKRDKLSADITKYWNIISIENVVNRNYKRTYDLKELYETIKGLTDERVIVKLKILCINMGLKKFSDLPADCNQLNVFKLCELQEIKVHLSRIRTLNPVLKSKKGKKALNKTEVLTSNWVKARIKELDLEILKLKEKLTKFNEETEFDDSAAPIDSSIQIRWVSLAGRGQRIDHNYFSYKKDFGSLLAMNDSAVYRVS